MIIPTKKPTKAEITTIAEFLKQLKAVDGSAASIKALLKELDKDEKAKNSCIFCKEEKGKSDSGILYVKPRNDLRFAFG